MSTAQTYLQLKTNLELELDLQSEDFISATELQGYFNEAVTLVSSEIHTIYEDYFLTKLPLSLVQGTQSYPLPADIFATKIRAIIYDDGGTKKYQIKQIRKIEDIPFVDASDDYRCKFLNDATFGNQLLLYPTSRETSSTNVTFWYLREAKQFTQDTDVCDLPEFTSVIIQYVRWKCLAKELHPEADKHLAEFNRLKDLMVQTLTNKIVDEDTTITPEFEFYRAFDSDFWWGR